MLLGGACDDGTPLDAEQCRRLFSLDANLFNHTNFQVGGRLGPVNHNNLNNLLFGQAGGTFPPRNLQFGLKLLF
jgi:hypothetical protein